MDGQLSQIDDKITFRTIRAKKMWGAYFGIAVNLIASLWIHFHPKLCSVIMFWTF
jgi:hypothetical protein